MRTLILGLGSEIRRDDAAGLLIARQLGGALQNPDVDVIECSVAGWSLLDIIAGYDKAIIIDSVCTVEGRVGRVRRLSVDDLSQWAGSVSPHRANLVSVLAAGKAIGLRVPSYVVIYAIEVSDPLGYGTEPTEEVRKAIPHVATLIAEREFQTPLPLSAVTGGFTDGGAAEDSDRRG